jgi:hypothetical protein
VSALLATVLNIAAERSTRMDDQQWVIDKKLKVNCRDCTAECCKHIAIPLDEPKTGQDLARIKWYLAHDNVSVYKDNEGDWLVEFLTKCGQLNGNRCMAWGTPRYPKICGEYAMDNCVMNEEGEYWEILFKSAADVDAYGIAHGIPIDTPLAVPFPACICIPLDPPEEWDDYDDMRWYIAHHDVRVIRQGTEWFAHLNTMCSMKHTCPYGNSHIPAADLVLSTWEDVEAHCREIGMLPDKLGKAALALTPK